MYSLNRVHLIGYQTQPLDVRTTPSGSAVVDLNLVVPYSFTNATGETQASKGFHTITLWSKMAEIAGQYVKAGSQVFIAGRLQTDSWEDEKTKEKRNKTKIIALDLIMLDPKDGLHAAPSGTTLISSGVNRAEIVGNLTRDPEVRMTTNGQQVVSMAVATNERWRDKQSGEDKERTEFHTVVLWGALGTEISQHAKKGNRVYVSGRVQTRGWETQTGEKRSTTEIVASEAVVLGTKNSSVTDAISNTISSPSRNEFSQAPSAAASSDHASMPDIQYASEVRVEDLPF